MTVRKSFLLLLGGKGFRTVFVAEDKRYWLCLYSCGVWLNEALKQ